MSQRLLVRLSTLEDGVLCAASKFKWDGVTVDSGFVSGYETCLRIEGRSELSKINLSDFDHRQVTQLPDEYDGNMIFELPPAKEVELLKKGGILTGMDRANDCWQWTKCVTTSAKVGGSNTLYSVNKIRCVGSLKCENDQCPYFLAERQANRIDWPKKVHCEKPYDVGELVPLKSHVYGHCGSPPLCDASSEAKMYYVVPKQKLDLDDILLMSRITIHVGNHSHPHRRVSTRSQVKEVKNYVTETLQCSPQLTSSQIRANVSHKIFDKFLEGLGAEGFTKEENYDLLHSLALVAHPDTFTNLIRAVRKSSKEELSFEENVLMPNANGAESVHAAWQKSARKKQLSLLEHTMEDNWRALIQIARMHAFRLGRGGGNGLSLFELNLRAAMRLGTTDAFEKAFENAVKRTVRGRLPFDDKLPTATAPGPPNRPLFASVAPATVHSPIASSPTAAAPVPSKRPLFASEAPATANTPSASVPTDAAPGPSKTPLATSMAPATANPAPLSAATVEITALSSTTDISTEALGPNDHVIESVRLERNPEVPLYTFVTHLSSDNDAEPPAEVEDHPPTEETQPEFQQPPEAQPEFQQPPEAQPVFAKRPHENAALDDPEVVVLRVNPRTRPNTRASTTRQREQIDRVKQHGLAVEEGVVDRRFWHLSRINPGGHPPCNAAMVGRNALGPSVRPE
ncbi:hypothetical protein R1sor_024554 [Riccia sorocarpa]|uniref:Uncharacterized protein n=1 Tax=Riccia sorocarpa TaxID=122646 RepID=A0ABD3GR03_9MARC